MNDRLLKRLILETIQEVLEEEKHVKDKHGVEYKTKPVKKRGSDEETGYHRITGVEKWSDEDEGDFEEGDKVMIKRSHEKGKLVKFEKGMWLVKPTRGAEIYRRPSQLEKL